MRKAIIYAVCGAIIAVRCVEAVLMAFVTRLAGEGQISHEIEVIE